MKTHTRLITDSKIYRLPKRKWGNVEFLLSLWDEDLNDPWEVSKKKNMHLRNVYLIGSRGG